MVWKKRDTEASDALGVNERLDRLGSEVISASSLNEDETGAIVSSPFLYTRVRARINAELTRREERESWLSILLVFWRAVPAMALVAVFCLVLFLSSGPGGLATAGLSEDGVPSAPDSGIERVVFAENKPLSNDEVLTTILGREDPEVTK
jgi:hypothetical protein